MPRNCCRHRVRPHRLARPRRVDGFWAGLHLHTLMIAKGFGFILWCFGRRPEPGVRWPKASTWQYLLAAERLPPELRCAWGGALGVLCFGPRPKPGSLDPVAVVPAWPKCLAGNHRLGLSICFDENSGRHFALAGKCHKKRSDLGSEVTHAMPPLGPSFPRVPLRGTLQESRSAAGFRAPRRDYVDPRVRWGQAPRFRGGDAGIPVKRGPSRATENSHCRAR